MAVRFTLSERADLDAQAEAAGTTAGAIVRKRVAAGDVSSRLIRAKRVPKPGGEVRKLVRTVETRMRSSQGGAMRVFAFGLEEFAELFGTSRTAVVMALRAKRFDPTDLRSVFAYLEQRRARAALAGEIAAVTPPSGLEARRAKHRAKVAAYRAKKKASAAASAEGPATAK